MISSFGDRRMTSYNPLKGVSLTSSPLSDGNTFVSSSTTFSLLALTESEISEINNKNTLSMTFECLKN
jgi:hypothetical protein